MKKILVISALLTLLLPACAKSEKTVNILPYPQQLEYTGGSFRASGAVVNCDDAVDARSQDLIKRFASQLSITSGRMSTFATPMKLAAAAAKSEARGFVFLLDNNLGEEEYSIEVSKKSLVVKASSRPGFFYALQTIKQMLPAAIYGNDMVKKADWNIPCLKISDKPAFKYRGMHLDVCRHFFSVEEVKNYIDLISMYKVNRFHIHLTEDQGWRIEIKKYPRLTEVGAFRNGTMIGKDFESNDGIRYGGFYTQEQMKDIVKYADERCITVIPEIDLPGHMQAALTSYPELGCTGGPYEVWTRWGISKQVLCPGKEKTMKFLEDVLAEIADIFPSEYIHIGGDECPKAEWKKSPECQALIRRLGLKTDSEATAEQRLQNYVTKRMQDFLEGKGKKIIGWDEILEGELAPGATVMSWRGTKGGIKAAQKGFDVIMSPDRYCYFDHCQSRDVASEPLCITSEKNPDRAVTIDRVYKFDPYEGLTPEQQKHILGVQANIWTEYISTYDYVQYMLLPRLCALSEVQWSKPSARDFVRLRTSVSKHFEIFDVLGARYRKKIDW